MTVTAHAPVTDEVVREIAEQVSQTMRRRLPRWGGTAFDIARGIEMYGNHLQTLGNLNEIRTNKDGSSNKSDKQVRGKSFEELEAHDQRSQGRESYTTDDLAELHKKDPDHPLFTNHPELVQFSKPNHPQTDIVEIHEGRLIAYQNKMFENPKEAVNAFLKDKDNDHFVVPYDQFDSTCEALKSEIAKGGNNAEDCKRILEGLKRSDVTSSQARQPRSTLVTKVAEDAAKRAAGAVATGVISDVALFAVGGAAMEVRDAWRNPGEMPLADRCTRLVRAIWDRFLASVKDRSVRELGSEAIAALASVLTAPLKMAATAVEKIVETLRRLWMDFAAGRLKTLEDVVSAGLKAAFVVASVGVAVAVEGQLAPLFASTGPVGDILAALCAAVVAGVMIVIGNRSIDHIVRSLFSLFRGAEVARRRREKVEAFCAEAIPRLITDRERLEALVETHLADCDALHTLTFADLQATRDAGDVDGFIKALNELSPLPWQTVPEFDGFMLGPDPLPLKP